MVISQDFITKTYSSLWKSASASAHAHSLFSWLRRRRKLYTGFFVVGYFNAHRSNRLGYEKKTHIILNFVLLSTKRHNKFENIWLLTHWKKKFRIILFRDWPFFIFRRRSSWARYQKYQFTKNTHLKLGPFSLKRCNRFRKV